MDDFEGKLAAFIAKSGIKAELLIFKTSCHSVEEAAASVDAKPEEFVKNICLIDREGALVVAIIPGDKRLDLKKAAAAGTGKVRFATPSEILERTGYPMGGTPSFGYPARVFIDREVLEKEVVYSGGGSQNALTKVSPAEIVRLSGAKEADLARKG